MFSHCSAILWVILNRLSTLRRLLGVPGRYGGLIVSLSIVFCLFLPGQAAWAESYQSPSEITQASSPGPTSAQPVSRRCTDNSRTGVDSARELPDSGMPPDIDCILSRGKLVVAVLNSDNVPFFMQADDDVTGLDITLAQAIADQLGVDLEINRSAKTFNGVVETVYDRRADIAISKISRTMKRAVRVRFSAPYLQMRQGLLINRLQLAQQNTSDNVTQTIRSLTGEVGVIKGSSYVGFLRQKFPQASIVEMESWADIVNAVSAGEILAGYRDELEIKKVMLTQPDAALNLQTVVLTDTQDALAIAFPWSSTHLLAFVDQYLDTLEQTYTVDSVLEAYAADVKGPEPPT